MATPSTSGAGEIRAGSRETAPRRRLARSVPVYTIPVPTPFPVGPVNVHLIAREPVTLVDTGPLTEDAWDALRHGLARHGFRVEDVERVLLTHGHQDHFGLAARITRAGRSQLLGGRLDRGHFRGARNRSFLLEALTRAGFGEVARFTMVAMTVAVDRFAEPLSSWDELSGGEVLPGDGWSVVVRSVPGHTPGSLTFEVPEAGVLFTGDTVLRDITPNAIVDEDPGKPGVAFRSVSRYFETLEGIEAGTARLLTGHGRRISDFAAHRTRLAGKYAFRVAQIERVLAGKPKTVAELCERVFPTVRPMDLYLAYSEILGFLMYLEDRNRVERLPGRLRERWTLVPS